MIKTRSWVLGVCAPDYVYNHLPKNQPNLEELSLITSYRRYGVRCTWRIPQLTGFQNITRFSWAGLTQAQLPILNMGFQTFAKQLVHLQLDFLATSTGVYTVHFGDGPPNEINADPLFGRLIVSLAAESEDGVVFPALRSLSLTNTALGPKSKELCRAFNTKCLEVLRLKNCLAVSWFLEALEKELELEPEEAASPLTVLELHLVPHVPRTDDLRLAMSGLMRRWRNLEDFVEYIVAKSMRVMGGYGLAATGDLSRTEGRHLMGLRCGSTRKLKRFVFHPGWRWEAPENSSEPSPIPELGPSERAYRAEPAMNPLSHVKLEFLGYAASPLYMVS